MTKVTSSIVWMYCIKQRRYYNEKSLTTDLFECLKLSKAQFEIEPWHVRHSKWFLFSDRGGKLLWRVVPFWHGSVKEITSSVLSWSTIDCGTNSFVKKTYFVYFSNPYRFSNDVFPFAHNCIALITAKKVEQSTKMASLSTCKWWNDKYSV